ncbi:MAG TPA: YaeQ family protein [Candidatus Polarisedimenticolia bacterium]|jgi:uncharacterized protein YaeQ|nr:YaeQ family protein [Candidatus Polarisedimenticolia bacterium]
MALTATLYSLDTELSDVDRGTYVSLGVRLARQPSETLEFMLTRYLAYCLEYRQGIELTEGIAAGEDPAILVRDLTGRITAWIEVGLPDAHRLHRGSKLAGRAAVYTHRNVDQVLAELNGKSIHRAAEIPVYSFGRGFVESIASAVKRRTKITLSITERHLYMDLDGQAFTTTVDVHRIA